MQPANPSFVCEVCGARVSTLRRGRCWICYVRWAEARPVGMNAFCVVCNDRRRENLRLVEFQGSWVPMCHNCSAKTLQLSPMPRTIEGIREGLNRDRRWKDRRAGKKDHRIFAVDRRTNERRGERSAEHDWLDAENLIIEILDAEVLSDDTAANETTRITPAPTLKP